LGGQKLVLKTDMPQHYVHLTSPRKVTRYSYEISGSPGERTLTPHLYTWRQTDWEGGEIGELNPFFDVNDPAAYDTGLINPRIPGQIAGPPQRTGGTPTAAAAIPTFGPFLGVSNGYVWLGHGTKIQSSTDGSTWTLQDTTAYQVTCPPCSDGRFIYFLTHDTPGGIGVMRIRRYDVATPTNQIVVDTTNPPGDGISRDSLGIAWLAGKLYRWTGTILRSFDLSAFGTGTAAITTGGTNEFSTGGDTAAADLASTKYGGACSTDNSVVFYISTSGQTFLYEFKASAGSQIASFVNGFTCKAICSYLGNVWLVGQQDGDAVVWRYDLGVHVDATFVNYIRRGASSAIDPVSVSPGPGNQVVIGDSAGNVFIVVYTPGQPETISLLDTRTGDGTLNAVVAYTNQRIAAMGKGSVTVKTSTWKPDSVVSTSVQNGNVTSGKFNFEFPEEISKGLFSVHTAFKPITGSETVIVSYKLDTEANFHALPTITSATPGAATGAVIQRVSQPYAVTAASWGAGSITYTIGANHLVKAGDVVNIYGLSPLAMNGLKTVASVGATTVLVTQSNPGAIGAIVGGETLEYTAKFNKMIVNTAITGGAVVEDVAVQMYPLAKDETWQFIIDVSDHAAAKAQNDSEAHELAAILFGSTANHTGQGQSQGLLRAGNVMQLLDGTMYNEPGEYDTYTVCIEQAQLDWQTKTVTVLVRNTSQAIGP
jgi:hypothetical protein